jgi:hypothetical protein
LFLSFFLFFFPFFLFFSALCNYQASAVPPLLYFSILCLVSRPAFALLATVSS